MVDLERAGTARIVAIGANGRPDPGSTVIVRDDVEPTLTGALLRFERDTGIPVKKVPVAVALAGAVIGDAVIVARSRWTFSRRGLNQFVGDEVTVVNEVAAKAWALTADPSAAARTVSGAAALDLAAPGRRAFVSFADGLGVALVDVDEARRITVLQTEAGHMTFAPRDAAEAAWLKPESLGAHLSWETALARSRRDGEPGWSAAELTRARARLIASFVADLTLATGAWQGTVLSGDLFAMLGAPDAQRAFSERLSARRQFQRQLASLPVWQVEQRDVVVIGCAALLRQRAIAG